jgi:hypothetical protein
VKSIIAELSASIGSLWQLVTTKCETHINAQTIARSVALVYT